MHIVTAAQVVLGQTDSNTTGGPPITLLLTLISVIVIVVAFSTLTSAIDAYRAALGAIVALAVGMARLSVVVGLLLVLLFHSLITRGQDSQQAPGAGTTTVAPGSPVAPEPQPDPR